MITRMQIINALIKQKKYQNYLEIGVYKGKCLTQIKAPNRIAIDPKFQIPFWRKLQNIIKDKTTQYFEKTSDAFFAEDGAAIEKMGGIDIAFIDGLHIYEQSNKDAENCLKYLNEGGIILLHDNWPPTAMAETRAHSFEEFMEMTDGEGGYIWTGDVWKTLVWLQCKYDDLHVSCLDTDYGIGVVYRSKNGGKKLNYTDEQIKEMTYEDLVKNGGEIINLTPITSISSFIKSIK